MSISTILPLDERISSGDKTLSDKDAPAQQPVVDALSMPAASYIIKNDDDLTLLCANEWFYELVGSGESVVRYRYGNRMSALFDREFIAQLELLSEKKDLERHVFEHTLGSGSGNLYLLTMVSMVELGEMQAFRCVSFDITEHYSRQFRLQNYEQIVRFVTDNTQYEVFLYDLKSGGASVCAARTIFGIASPDNQLEIHGLLEYLQERGMVSQEYLEEIKSAIQTMETMGRSSCELRMKNLRGELVWAELTLELQSDQSAGPRMALGLLQIITQQKEAFLNYIHQTQFYQAMLSESDAYAHIDVTENRISKAGGLWKIYNEIIDTVTYSELIEQFINKVVHLDDREHYLEIMQCKNLTDSLQNGINRLGCEFRRIVEQNKMVWMEITIHLFYDPITRHTLALLYLKNIDTRKKQELMMLHSAEREYLTNIYNKNMAEALARDYLHVQRKHELCCFMVMDLDHFEQINQQFGRTAGDDLLARFSTMLSRIFRRKDVVGRLGSDEFTLFIKNVRSKDWLEERMEALYELMRMEQDPPLSCSMGVTFVQQGTSYEEMFMQADTALYAAKREDQGRFVIYSDSTNLTNLPAPVRDQETECLPLPVSAIPLREKVPEDDLPEKWDGFDRFIGENGEIAYLVDPDTFELLIGNDIFYQRVGLTRGECTGMRCFEVMHRRQTPCPFCSKANWSSDKFYMWRNMNQALEQEFLIKNKMVQWRGREAVLAIAVDISNDKSIVDSLETKETENHNILDGILRMLEAENLNDALDCALESIAYFFRANLVRLWSAPLGEESYRCLQSWSGMQDQQSPMPDDTVSTEVDRWLRSQNWQSPVFIDSADVMLGYSHGLYQLMKKYGVQNQYWVPLRDQRGELGILCIQNMTANFQNVSFLNSFSMFILSEHRKRQMMESLRYAGTHDALTGLLNRSCYEDFVYRINPDAVSSIGVLVADINDIKGVNTTRGFHIGDRFIKEAAEVLGEVFEGYQIFRLNGDEFMILATGVVQARFGQMAAELERRLGQLEQFSVSLGYAWDNVEKDLEHLIRAANHIMKLNKSRYYDSKENVRDTKRREMLNELMNAIENRKFEVFLQPKVDFTQNCLIGAEALIRYRHPELGVLPPAKFIDTLENTGLIRYVDLFVFEEVCRLFERYKKEGIECPPISLNFSRTTLMESDIVTSVEALIARYHTDKSKIEIEITESFSDMGKGALFQVANGLYQSGFSISLDDFGTKYTNLSILSELEFDTLKLDKSLIHSLAHHSKQTIILKNVTSMCRELGIRVIAEGVETKAQEQMLQQLGCTCCQGYLYGKPMEILQFEKQFLIV